MKIILEQICNIVINIVINIAHVEKIKIIMKRFSDTTSIIREYGSSAGTLLPY